MKALVISDRSEIIDFVTPLLKDKGFDLIHYRWIIKALDNIEEIQPDIIVLSAMEYPRHWKTLAGFVQSGIGGNDVKMYLYYTEPLSTDDAKKADDLGVLSIEQEFTDFMSVDVIDSKDVELAYNDSNGKIRFCNAKYNPENQCVSFSISSEINLENGFVKYVSMFDVNSVISFSADAQKENDSICLYVKDYYEKEV